MTAIKHQSRILVCLAALLVTMSVPPATAQNYKFDAQWQTPKVMYTTKRSNVRTGPGTSYGKVGLLEVGEQVFVSAKTGNWFKLKPKPEQEERFVYAPLLTAERPELGTGSTKSIRASSGVTVEAMIYSNGDRYHGQIRNGRRHGRGVFTWPSGDRYEGDFVNGKRTGRGVYTWPSGDRYEGDFVNGKRTGRGVYTWPSGNRYEGDFVNGKRTGRGVFTYADGRRWEGGFRDGKRTGRGIFTYADGRRWEGNYVDGKPGRGTWTQPVGTERARLQQTQQTADTQLSSPWGAIVVVESEGDMSRGTAWDWPSAERAHKAAHDACKKRGGYCDLENSNRVIQVVFSTSAKQTWWPASRPVLVAGHSEYPKHRILSIAYRCVTFYDEVDGPPSVAFGNTKAEAESVWKSSFIRSSYYMYGKRGETLQTFCNKK